MDDDWPLLVITIMAARETKTPHTPYKYIVKKNKKKTSVSNNGHMVSLKRHTTQRLPVARDFGY